MTLLTTPQIGLEHVQREAYVRLLENLNGAIEEIEADMETSDKRVWLLQGNLEGDFAPTEIERIDPQNFYEGHRPSLINSPSIDRYPNCSCWTIQATPAAGSDQYDQIDVYRNLLYVEILVKASPEEGEGIVNRRALRTAEAVNAVIMGDPTLNGIVSGFEDNPTVRRSDVFTKKEQTSYGPHWYWQGVRLEYAVRKEATLPSTSPGSIFGAAPPGHYDIDQG